MTPHIRYAYAEEHGGICKIAKQSPYSKGFIDVRFVSDYYQKRWIGVETGLGGFICLRHLTLKPYTNVYYLGVDRSARRTGIGRGLLDWAIKTSPWQEIILNSEKSNKAGISLFESLGFVAVGEGANKKGVEHWCFSLKIN